MSTISTRQYNKQRGWIHVWMLCNFPCLMFCFCLPNDALRIHICLNCCVCTHYLFNRESWLFTGYYMFVYEWMDLYIMAFSWQIACKALGTFVVSFKIYCKWYRQTYKFQITFRYNAIIMKLWTAVHCFHFDLFLDDLCIKYELIETFAFFRN